MIGRERREKGRQKKEIGKKRKASFSNFPVRTSERKFCWREKEIVFRFQKESNQRSGEGKSCRKRRMNGDVI